MTADWIAVTVDDSCLLNIIFNQVSGRCACTFASKMCVCARAPPSVRDQVEESMWLGTVWSVLNKVVLELIILLKFLPEFSE